jgi:hypothetical protein
VSLLKIPPINTSVLCKKKKKKKKSQCHFKPGMVVHGFNPSPWEAEEVGYL